MTGTAPTKLFAALALALVLCACSATSKVAPADAFANAGIAYADAVPSVYDESFVLAVTADSLVLRQIHKDLTPEQRADMLSQRDEPLEKRLKLLRRLKQHALALRAYFIALKSITQSDAAAGITEATQGLLNRMAVLKPEIVETTVFGSPIGDLIGPAVELGVGAYQNVVLKRELEARGPAIERELELQRAALAVISEQMIADRDLQIQVEERNPLVFEFAKDGSLPKDWSDRRIAAFRRTIEINSLDAAARSADNLHQSWIALVEGRLGDGGLILLLDDVEQLVRLAATLSAKE